MSKPKAFTKKQQLFCDEYLIDFNATRAAKDAGYSKKTAYSIGQENLKKPEIQKYLAKRMKERKERVEIDQDFVLDAIVETITMNRQRTKINAVRIDDKGEAQIVLIDALIDSKGVLKGTEQLGKHLGMFKEGVNISGMLILEKSPDLHAADIAANLRKKHKEREKAKNESKS